MCVPKGQCSSYVNPQNKDYQVDYQIDPRTMDKGILAEEVAEENSTASTTPATRRRRDLEQVIAEEVEEKKTKATVKNLLNYLQLKKQKVKKDLIRKNFIYLKLYFVIMVQLIL